MIRGFVFSPVSLAYFDRRPFPFTGEIFCDGAVGAMGRRATQWPISDARFAGRQVFHQHLRYPPELIEGNFFGKFVLTACFSTPMLKIVRNNSCRKFALGLLLVAALLVAAPITAGRAVAGTEAVAGMGAGTAEAGTAEAGTEGVGTEAGTGRYSSVGHGGGEDIAVGYPYPYAYSYPYAYPYLSSSISCCLSSRCDGSGAVGLYSTVCPLPLRPSPQAYWYYCASSRAYYPTVQRCRETWIPVPPTP